MKIILQAFVKMACILSRNFVHANNVPEIHMTVAPIGIEIHHYVKVAVLIITRRWNLSTALSVNNQVHHIARYLSKKIVWMYAKDNVLLVYSCSPKKMHRNFTNVLKIVIQNIHTLMLTAKRVLLNVQAKFTKKSVAVSIASLNATFPNT